MLIPPQCWASLLSTTRNSWSACTEKSFPVAGSPIRGPVFVPEMTAWIMIWSPSAGSWSMTKCELGNAAHMTLRVSTAPSGPTISGAA